MSAVVTSVRLVTRTCAVARAVPNPYRSPHERLQALRAGFRNEPEVRERVFSVEVDDELNYLPIADLE